jgi:hypothetical protein
MNYEVVLCVCVCVYMGEGLGFEGLWGSGDQRA